MKVGFILIRRHRLTLIPRTPLVIRVERSVLEHGADSAAQLLWRQAMLMTTAIIEGAGIGLSMLPRA